MDYPRQDFLVIWETQEYDRGLLLVLDFDNAM